jgi:DNA-binding Lrp family transcriptional regulator
LVAATQEGLPLEPTPFAVVAQRVGTTEAEVLRRLRAWSRDGTLRRIGVIVRHRTLGYRANAMVVWDVPDEQVADLGGRLGRSAGVTLCYRRRRVPPLWPYNLYCMLHGRGRTEVTALLDELAEHCGMAEVPREILFSGRCFKQRGARYQPGVPAAEVANCAMRRVAGA